MNLVTRGIRNAFRNVIRTVSIAGILALSIGLALAMLVANRAVGQKIESVQASVGNTINISAAGIRGFEGGGKALTETELAKVQDLAHVTSLTKVLNDRLTTDNTNLQSAIDAGDLGKRFSENNGQSFKFEIRDEVRMEAGDSNRPIVRTFTPPVTLVGTTSPKELSALAGGGSFTLKTGEIFAGNSTENVALVGSTLAEKNNLSVGSTFTAYGKTITVKGIFDAGNSFANNQVLMPLAAVQTLSGQAGAITAAVATVDSVTNIDSATTAIKNALGDSADVTNQAERAKESIEPLKNIQTVSLYSLIGAVAAGAAIILMTMIMIVRERRREIGVAKAIGASNGSIVGQFMAEAVTLTGLASVLGIIIGAAAANPITRMLVDNTDASTSGPRMIGDGPGPGMRMAFRGVREGIAGVTASVGWDIILYGLGAALLIAIIGSVLASFFIARIRPSEVLRTD